MSENLTNINLTGAIITILAGLFTIMLPRRLALIPLVVTSCFITLGQRVDVFGINFTVLRIMILFGWVRLMLRKEFHVGTMTAIDKSFVLWNILSVATYTILVGTFAGFVSSLGPTYNAIGVYFYLRCLIRTEEDVKKVVYIIAILIVPLALFMILEKATGRNIFSAFGGVPEFTMIRDGELRCQGPFAHPILAGTFGATSFPLLAAMWLSAKGERKIVIVGLLGALFILITSASSGPLMALAAGMLWMSLWRLRAQIKIIYVLFFTGVVGLHLVMKAPIWFLIGRLAEIIGGSGWQRSVLIDEAIKHFGEWWLVGTAYTAHWQFDKGLQNILIILPSDPNMVDITNQFIYIGINGGMVTLFLFLIVIGFGFKGVGSTVNGQSRISEGDKLLAWGMGGALSAHVTSFFGVVYFDQMIVFWFMCLAMINCIYNAVGAERDRISGWSGGARSEGARKFP